METAVVSVTHGVMASLLGKLGDLLTDKYKLLKGAKGEIMFLKAELESMHVFLKKMSDADEPADEQARCWAKEVRELSYDIEDSVDEFIHREREYGSEAHGFKGFIERSINLLATMNARHKITMEFQGLKRRVMEASERRMRYKFDDDVSKQDNTTIDIRLLALYAEPTGLVGTEGPRDELIQLMDEEAVPAHQLKVLSVVGFGGLGKTTLANEIYRKQERRFECRAFISVSQKPNIGKIMRTMLSQVGFVPPENTNMEMWEEAELISALRSYLLDKRYFIIIDDIWEDSAWDIIKCALPENMKGSRVITTTRIESVARVCCANHFKYVYKMKPLSNQESRKLFFKRVFGSEDACPANLEEVSVQILRKCGGLPLAIITMSSLLASQPNKLKEQWEYVRNSLGSNLDVNPSLEGMRQILNLSYINLPHYLKACMLYLCVYPEDYVIHKIDLTRQWVAEGFISKGIDPEHVAKSYFNELINRSMIQPKNIDKNGEVMSCRVHDMMLDLILLKSRKENFITVIDNIQGMDGHCDKIRRLSLHLNGAVDDRRVGSIQLSQIRTVARFGTSPYLPPFLQLKHLRVLTIEISEGSRSSMALTDFTGICHLFQLRYIKILANGCSIVLPSKIGGLQQLETFHIETQVLSLQGQPFCVLPSDIVHIRNLLHLIVPWSIRLPDGIWNMKSLRILRLNDLGRNSVDDIKGLGELTNLTDLEVGWYSIDDDYVSSDEVMDKFREVLHICLEKLSNLRYLRMTTYPLCACLDQLSPVPSSLCHNLQRFHAYCSWFSRVPVWFDKLHNLNDLFLSVKDVLGEDVQMLAQLPSLVFLNLRILGNPKDGFNVRGNGFPVLKHFTVICSRMPHLTFEAGAMAKLERLELVFNALGWSRYGAAPIGTEHLSVLKKISVHILVAGAERSDRKAACSALRNVVVMHPGRPASNIECHEKEMIVFDTDEMSEEHASGRR